MVEVCEEVLMMKISWFSAGVSSAVATKIAEPDLIIYIDIEDQHSDTYRFLDDCQEWFEKEIVRLQSPYKSVESVCRAVSYMNGPGGATCSKWLKRRVRKEWEFENCEEHTYVWGFDGNEKDRAERITVTTPEHNHNFPLLNRTKAEVHGILERAGIKRPALYDMLYPNNNCIGCLRGGMGYWNKIKIDFPEVFANRAKMERDIGAHILKECYLDELDPNRGRNLEVIVPDCGMFCETEKI